MKIVLHPLASRLLELLLLAAVALAPAAWATPPDWAPAHGYRDHHGDQDDQGEDDDHHRGYRGYNDREWDRDYGVVHGHCDRAAIGAVLGGAAGGVIGANAGSSHNRPVAILLGAALGSFVGYQIGRELDRADRGCIGHALELVPYGRTVAWRDEQRGIDYRMTPIGPWTKGGVDCREFRLESANNKRSDSRVKHACRSGDGEWQIR
jgi:surface antigen